MQRNSEQIYYVIVLFPTLYYLVSFFVFRLAFVAAISTAILWFISFFIAGLLYHRMIVSRATKRPHVRHLDEPKDYILEDGWLITRTSYSESRILVSRAVGLTVASEASFLDLGGLATPVILPFGSISDRSDQREFLEALQKEVVNGKSA